MSEIKTIKGKVEFLCMPITHKPIGVVDCVQYPSDLYEQFKLSTITESQASLLVNLTWNSNEEIKYKTAKESLFSLLKANGCWTSDMKMEYDKGNNFRHDVAPLEGSFLLPDDYLLIIKQ